MKKADQLINTIKTNGPIKEETNRSTTQTSYKCDKCKDIGFIINIEKNSGRPCDCRELRKFESIIAASEISEAYLEYSFNSFDIKGKHEMIKDAKYIAMKYVKEFIDVSKSKNNSIAFLGQPGIGKTHLSIAIANNLMKKMIPVLYMPYRDAITYLKQVITDEIIYQKEISKYKKATVLLIDDLFKGAIRNGKVNESDISIMFEIINYRYLKKLPVIISTEKSIDDLLDFDEATGSRIIEMAKGRLIEIRGKNLNHRLGG